MDHMNEVARRKVNGPVGWEIFRWERIGSGMDFVVEGGVPRLLTRGPRKGQKTWDGDRSKTVVAETEIAAELERYETKTGNCGDCGGTGAVFAGWSEKEGTRTRPCRRCGATGKSPNTQAEGRGTRTLPRMVGGKI